MGTGEAPERERGREGGRQGENETEREEEKEREREGGREGRRDGRGEEACQMSASVAALAPFLLPVSSLSSTLLDTSEKTSELSLRALCLTAEPQQSPLLSVLFSRRPKRGPLATYRKDFPLGRDGQPGKASVMPLMGGRYQARTHAFAIVARVPTSPRAF